MGNVVATEGALESAQGVTLRSLLEDLERHIGSRRKAADVSGISRGVIEAILRGQTTSPTNETLEKLSATLQQLERWGDPLLIQGQPFTASPEELKRLPISPAAPSTNGTLQAQAKATLKIRTRPVIAVAIGAIVSPELGQETQVVDDLQRKLQACLEKALKEFDGFSQSECATVSPVCASDNPAPNGASGDQDLPQDLPQNAPQGDLQGDASDHLDRLEATFSINSALLLSTLVDAEISRLGLESLEDFGRHLARTINPEPNLELTQRFTEQLTTLSEEYRLPEDDGQRVTLLVLLAATLRNLQGQPFGGNLQALLEYLGV